MAVNVTVLIPAKSAENTQTDCIEWTGFKSRDGYGIVNRKRKLRKVHRIAYAEANGLSLDDIDGVVIRHKCDNRSCINPVHLEPGTSRDNTRDRKERGRCARGERNGNSKLTQSQVSEIRDAYRPYSRTHGAKVLAKKFNVSFSLVQQIIANVIWKEPKESANGG